MLKVDSHQVNPTSFERGVEPLPLVALLCAQERRSSRRFLLVGGLGPLLLALLPEILSDEKFRVQEHGETQRYLAS